MRQAEILAAEERISVREMRWRLYENYETARTSSDSHMGSKSIVRKTGYSGLLRMTV